MCSDTDTTTAPQGVVGPAGHETGEHLQAGMLRTLRTYEAFQRLSSEVVVVCDVDGTLVYASPAVSSLFGYAPLDVITCDVWSFIHDDDLPAARAEFGLAVASAGTRTSRLRVRAADGTWRWVEQSSTNLLDASVGGIVTTLRDVTEQVAADDALRASETRLRAIAETADEGLWAIGTDGSTLFANARMATMLGLPAGEPCELAAVRAIDPAAAAALERRRATTGGRSPERFEIAYRHPDGAVRALRISTSTLTADEDALMGTLAMVTDISDVRAAEEELRVSALRDALTQLPNRTLLLDRLQQALSRPHLPTAVLVVGLDDFRMVNDTRGHDVGDLLLQAVARRLVGAVRPHDTVARLSGDEFAVVCEDVDAFRAREVAQNVLEAFGLAHELSGERLQVGASVGVTISAGEPATGEAAAGLLRQADTALRAAKAVGRGQMRLFDQGLAEDVKQRYALAADLRGAIEHDELSLSYQPVVDLETNRVLGMEALARGDHATRGPVSPCTFVQVAEATGLERALDRWVLQRALTDAARLHAAGAVPEDAFVAVNLSARTLTDEDLEADLAAMTARAGLSPRQVVLEITETAIMRDADVAVALLKRLREQGFQVALDDFGTGYSSLAYLRDLPVSTLKIDRSFVVDIASSPRALAIVTAVVDLARAVGVRVVAEGVETREQRALLRDLGCASAQGWLWAPGIPPEEIEAQRWCAPLTGFGTDLVARSAGTVASSIDVLERLLELHRGGASPSTIAAALNAQGSRTAAGARWHRATVTRALAEAAAVS